MEGEPQKAFGRSLSLFMELSDITCRMSAVMGNLLQQLDSIYSPRDTSGRSYRLFRNVTFKSAFASFGDGLAVFLVLDEILMQNENIKSYISLFMRYLLCSLFDKSSFVMCIFLLSAIVLNRSWSRACNSPSFVSKFVGFYMKKAF